MSFISTSVYKTLTTANSGVAIVTGGKSGIGKALALKIASFPFIDKVIAVSRSIPGADVKESSKIEAVAADLATEEGRKTLLQKVTDVCGPLDAPTKPVRFLIHSAGTIDPIKSVLHVKPDELRNAMVVNCEAPLFLTTALYPYLAANDSIAGRVLHVSSGAAHGAPPVGWSCYGISKAAFY